MHWDQGKASMPGLEGFLNAAQAEKPSASLACRPGQPDLTTRSGRAARWIGHLRFSENRRVTSRFIQALKSRHGGELIRDLASSHGLRGRLARNRPLSARKVQEVIRAANTRQAAVRQDNELLARCVGSTAPQGAAAESIRTVLEQTATLYLPANSPAVQLIDWERLAGEVEQAVVAAGRDGTHKVTLAEARNIRATIANGQATAAIGDYYAARAGALEKLDVLKPDSIAHREFHRAVVPHVSPLLVAQMRLSPDAAETIRKRFLDALDNGAIPVDELDDDDELRALAHREAARFVAERAAASAGVAALENIAREAKLALVAQVTCDDMSPELAEQLGHIYILVRDSLAQLSDLRTAGQVESAVRWIHDAMHVAFDDAGIKVDERNEGLLYRMAWRFLLAPEGAARARNLGGQLASPDSPLRALGEAAAWYATGFADTAERSRIFKDVRPAQNGREIYPGKSFTTANEYAQMMLCLAAVLEEKRAASNRIPPLTPDPNPTDQTVAILRNLNIPFPAPDGANRFNGNAPLSVSAMAEIREELNRHMQIASRETDRSGLVKNTRRFLQHCDRLENRDHAAQYIIDGKKVPKNTKDVGIALRKFCKGADGRVNQTMLTNICLVANPALLNCAYFGCMNPNRPDLAIFNGYAREGFEGRSFSLSKHGEGEIRLRVEERASPEYLYPVDLDTVVPALSQSDDESAHAPNPVALDARRSHFSAQVDVKFTTGTYEPEIDGVKINYCLVPSRVS